MPVWAGSLDWIIHAKNEPGDHSWFFNNGNIVNINIFRISIKIISNRQNWDINDTHTIKDVGPIISSKVSISCVDGAQPIIRSKVAISSSRVHPLASLHQTSSY